MCFLWLWTTTGSRENYCEIHGIEQARVGLSGRACAFLFKYAELRSDALIFICKVNQFLNDAEAHMTTDIKHDIEDEALARQRLRLWLQMLKAVRYVEGTLRERLRSGYDTTLPRFDVLAALHARQEGMKMSELSQHLVVSNGNVTGVVDRLVSEGLAERENMPTDRRAFLVRITDKGRKLMDEMAAEHMRWIDEMFEDVSEADAARGISIMLDIRQKS